MIDTTEINKKMKKVPPHLWPEIVDYIDFLLAKYGEVAADERRFDFSWEGGLADMAQDYDSVELQHKAMEWR